MTIKIKVSKSWFVQSVAVLWYIDYLLSGQTAIAGQEYEVAILGVIIAYAVKLAITIAISMAVGYLTAKKPSKPRHAQPTGLAQFDVPTAEEGRAVQVLFGKRYIGGPNVVWYGDLKSVAIQVRM